MLSKSKHNLARNKYRINYRYFILRLSVYNITTVNKRLFVIKPQTYRFLPKRLYHIILIQDGRLDIFNISQQH